MIQQISYYISKAGIISAAGKTEDERRRLSEMPTPAAFVSYAPSLPALVGWYGHRVAFNGVGAFSLRRRWIPCDAISVCAMCANGLIDTAASMSLRLCLPCV